MSCSCPGDPRGFPSQLAHRFFDLGRAGLIPVLAHPERYHGLFHVGRLDRDSEITVPDSHMGPCTFKSLKKSDPPPSRKKKHKDEAAADAPK